MSMPTKEQWQKIVSDLDKMYVPVFLLCDGFYVRYCLERMKNKLVITVYVNGWIKGEWSGINDDISEEARRFWRPATKSKHSVRDIKFYEKACGKRWCKKHDIYGKYTIVYPYWNSVQSLIRYLMKNNKSIHIIDHKTHEAGIVNLKEE